MTGMTRPERVTLVTDDGLRLQARWDGPADLMVVVFCHPHPLHGGTMFAPLMHKVTKRLAQRGLRVLRFNFRGVGESEGAWDDGRGETEDVGAAVAVAEATGLPVGVAGWSFGGGIALRWQGRAGDARPFAGIAPALMLAPDQAELPPARRLLILGDRDQFVTEQELTAFADSINARAEIMRGSDHFFHFREERVADLIADWLLGNNDEGVNQDPDEAADDGSVDADELEVTAEE